MVNRRKFLTGSLALAAGTSVACGSSNTIERPQGDWVQEFRAAQDDDLWKIVRKQFPLTTDRVYFNTGGLGPASYPVLDAVTKTAMDLQRISETGHSRLNVAREAVAKFFGADPGEIAFTRNATEGNATIASGLNLQSGDEVIFESHAHPGGAMAWMVRQKEEGIKVKIFEPSRVSSEENLQRLKDLITPRTRAIQVSHITAPTGIVMPVQEIAALATDANAWFHVDGAQSAGMIPINLRGMHCDSYATSGHKWLGAPHGTGFLYVKKDRLGEIVPTEAGAYANSDYDLPGIFDYAESAQRFESGTRDASAVVGIKAAVEFQDTIGKERIAEYSIGLARYLREKLAAVEGVHLLSPTNPRLDSAMTTVRMDQMRYDDLYRFLLNDHSLRCRIVTERGLDGLRISTHLFNSRDDCDRAIAAISTAAAG